ncbi:MAG TPA: serine hydrolase domain-containing protein, partial [Actinomycetota bacterium]|nr:serine hydrolase domain-containing protein [Actinomycetota bacterium]
MHDVLSEYIEREDVPGLVTLVSRRGEEHFDAIGSKSLGGGPMANDTIFRIASLSKPVFAAAAMILVEECKLGLDEPVDRLLPEMADRKVLKLLDGPLEYTVSANRPITLRDLLTQRMGFGSIMEPSDHFPIVEAVKEQEIGTIGPENSALDPDEWIRRLGSLPLMAQPGERWMYNTSFSVLGVLMARASGQSLEAFLKDRIFDPLGMTDTSFTVPESKMDRLAGSYRFSKRAGKLKQNPDELRDGGWFGRDELASTAQDFARFGQMMLNNGKFHGGRILSRPSVETMIIDHMTPEQKAASPFFPGFWDNRGWGFGVSIVTRRDDIASVPGRYGWDGGTGTSWYADPTENLHALL